MCLISVCPKGTEKYNETVESFIRAGFHGNGHGSGLMWKKEGEDIVNIKKGFFNLDELLEFVKNLDLKKEDELAIHHRIGTQGARNGANTHPFVITDNHEICISEEGSYNLPALMHNGIFYNIKQHEVQGYSDTYAFAHGVMSNPIWLNLLKAYPEHFEKALSEVVQYQRICFMFPDKDLMMIGNFHKSEGYYHSNHGYYDYGYKNVGGKESRTRKKDMTTTRSTSEKSVTSNKQGYSLHSSLVLDNNDENLKHSCELGNNHKKIIKLDDINIVIDKNNYADFIYLLKDGCKIMEGIVVGQAYKATSFDSIEGMVALYEPTNEKMLYCIKTSELRTCFYYHPLTKHKKIYNDYLILQQKLIPTKSQLKKLVSQLSSKYNKEDDSKFIVKKLGIPFCKRAVELYVNKHKGEFLDGQTKKIISLEKFDQEGREFAFTSKNNFSE